MGGYGTIVTIVTIVTTLELEKMGLLGTLKNKTAEEKISVAVVEAKLTPPARPAVPCETCRSPFFWSDIFGAVRCLDCTPPPVRSMVRRPLWGIAGPPGGPWWWETLENPPRVFRADQTARNATGEALEPQVVEWLFPSANCRQSRRIISVVDRPRVDRGTLHWGSMTRTGNRKGTT